MPFFLYAVLHLALSTQSSMQVNEDGDLGISSATGKSICINGPVLVSDSLAINDVDVGGQLSRHGVDIESLLTTVNALVDDVKILKNEKAVLEATVEELAAWKLEVLSRTTTTITTTTITTTTITTTTTTATTVTTVTVTTMTTTTAIPQQYAASGGKANWLNDPQGQINENGLHCKDMCGEGNSMDWESMQEQLDFCNAVAQIVIGRTPRGPASRGGGSEPRATVGDPSSFSYPLIHYINPGNNRVGACCVNKDASRQVNDDDAKDHNMNFKGSDGDVVFCKCKKKTKYTISGMPTFQAFEIKKFAFAGTWTQEKEFCEGKGGRLPYVSEVCSIPDVKPAGGYCDGTGAGGSGVTTDKWAAVLDKEQGEGEYFGCSSDLMDNHGNDRRGCEAHAEHAGGIPGWTDHSKSARWKGWTYCRIDKD